MSKDPDWKVIVRELQWNLFEKVYPLWKRELAPGKRQLCENDRDNVFAAAGEVSSSKALVVQLPQEVWELIIADLDGLSFLRLVHSVTNLGIGQVLWDALKANVTAKKVSNSAWVCGNASKLIFNSTLDTRLVEKDLSPGNVILCRNHYIVLELYSRRGWKCSKIK